jgi:Sulfotransferase family
LFYGIGAQKAGTTWLHRYCADHPELHAPNPKELDYWGTIRPPYRAVPRRTARRELKRAVPRLVRAIATLHGIPQAMANLARKRRICAMYARDDPQHAAYLGALTFGMQDGQVAADISPQYAVVGRETFAEMAAMHPEARFVFLLREPVARLWSSVRHQKRAEITAGRLDAAGVAAECTRVLGDPTRFSHMATDYARTLAELDADVAPDRVLCLFYETLFQQGSIDRFTRFSEGFGPAGRLLNGPPWRPSGRRTTRSRPR